VRLLPTKRIFWGFAWAEAVVEKLMMPMTAKRMRSMG
jgi:hypothetical protein